ncbi:GNAT family N-acetyltransferase [Cytobacillus purgationiresistens]|uniref:Acetyltransferase n=1 Tax=Cytobacillus purgationiresistens TaxID=863449 RepID=A0ABU0AN01_9BACI|nr:GNAT family N-acetyltransferase [Cytobacillus purgationiresistens]MDQ0271430.1 putative acetyltransferase [Cytobacillus purgationiresistens]
MYITLQKAEEDKKTILRNLYSFYLHDLSRYSSNLDVNEEGFFDFEDLNFFWSHQGITPYFIKMEEEIIGFLLLLERPFLKKENDFIINDIFILNKYKGKGLASMALKKLFDEKNGQYGVVELQRNLPAISFWKKIYREMKIEYIEKSQIVDDEQCLVQTFKI